MLCHIHCSQNLLAVTAVGMTALALHPLHYSVHLKVQLPCLMQKPAVPQFGLSLCWPGVHLNTERAESRVIARRAQSSYG